MKTIAVGKFKAHCLALIEEIAQTHEPIIITKYSKPLVKVIPITDSKDDDHKPLKSLATYIGDIFSPIDTEWEA